MMDYHQYLAQVQEFTLQDLALNRKGQVGPNQGKPGEWTRVIGWISALIFLVGLLLFLLKTVQGEIVEGLLIGGFVSLMGLFGIGFASLMILAGKYGKDGTVAVCEDYFSKEVEEVRSKGTPSFLLYKKYFLVSLEKSKRFQIKKPTYDAFLDVLQHRIYHTSSRVLSIEVRNDVLAHDFFKPQ